MIAQDINVSLEDALKIIGGGGNHKVLKNKLLHSIDLIRKAEKLALLYDRENGFYNTFSGGKDSQAMFYVAKMAGVKFQTHMNFTSVDPPQVVRFVRKQYPNVIFHSPKKSIFQIAVERGILPSMRVRWCCADLKESAGAGKVTLIGIRKEESTRRAKRHEVEVSNKSFSGNLDEFELWQKEQLEKKEDKLIKKMKREGKKVNEDEFSLSKDNEVRCINGKDSILISPIFDWTEKDVWYFLNEVIKAPHCELYDKGYKRIGCILCPMSSYKQKIRELKDFPHVKRGWIKAIKEIRRGNGLNKHTYLNERSNSGQVEDNEVLSKKWRQIKEHHDGKMFLYGRIALKLVGDAIGGEPSTHIKEASISRHESRHDIQHRERTNTGILENGGIDWEDNPNEDEIAENIFDWWISGKAYSKWYADRFLQLKINFEFDENNEREAE